MTDTAETLVPVESEQKLDFRLNELRRESLFCDVRFNINGKIFPCHRLVLIAVSQYFDTMFNGHFKESGPDIISLKEIEAETFEEILNAIYTGNIRLLPSNAYFILKASHLFLLEAVEKTCVSYIKKNLSSVHYLVEICLFAKNIQQHSLYLESAKIISNDLINYGKTDSFVQIPVDIFESILESWYPKSYEEEFTVLLLSKWCKDNGSRREDFQRLLASARLHAKKYINPMLMARAFTILSDDTFIETKNQISEVMDSDVNLDLNLYLNVIDTKTGQKGWGVLKTNDKFDTFILSSFHPTYSSYKRVCKVGSKIYCFEYFAGEKRNVFSSYDENIASFGTSIYLTTMTEKQFSMLVYDCNLKSWRKCIVKIHSTGTNDFVSAHTYLNGFFYVIIEMEKIDRIEIRLLFIDSRSSVIKRIKSSRLTSSDGEGYVLYGFDNKLVGFNRKDLSFKFFDLVSEAWLDEHFKWNFNHENFCLIHHKDFLYVVENDRAIVNERFDLKKRTLEQLPSFPKRITFGNTNDARVLGTGSVFDASSEATKN